MSTGHCIFCQIVRGESPCEEIYRDALTLAFMDIHPVHDGHCLVIPTSHFETVFDMPPALFGAVASSVVRVARAVHETIRPGGVSIVQANGPLAGQTVPHVHVHVLPRRAGDDLMINWARERTAASTAEPARIAAIAEKLRARRSPGSRNC
jgi:histidine triad (HIT) family protein